MRRKKWKSWSVCDTVKRERGKERVPDDRGDDMGACVCVKATMET